MLLFIFHASEVEKIIFEISKFQISNTLIPLLFNSIGFLFIIAIGYSYFKFENYKEKLLKNKLGFILRYKKNLLERYY